VSEDPVGGLERLSELHRTGELSDAEFEDAKRELLHGAAAGPVTRAPAPAPAPAPSAAIFPAAAPSPSPRRSRSGISISGSVKLLVIAIVVVGFVLGIAALIVAEVAPSSAQWTKALVCSSGEQLVTNGGVVHNNGGSAQGATHFYCAPAGQPVSGLDFLSLPEKTGNVLLLSFLLGFVIGAVLTVIAAVVLSMRSGARISDA